MAIRIHEDLTVKEILRELVGLIVAAAFFAAAIVILFEMLHSFIY